MGAACNHGHHHNHGHQHHGHHHAATGRIGFAFSLNLSFAIIELIGGFLVNSVAILSDAVHDFGDAMVLGTAWWLEKKSQQKGDQNYSYGYRRLSVLAALITGIVLLAGAVIILTQTLPRLWNPVMPHIEGMLGLAVLGVGVNGAAAFRLSKGTSLNEKMITWHLLEDLLGWIVVLIGAVVMWFYPEPLIDAALALVLTFWVVWNVFKNLRSTVRVFLQRTPEGLTTTEIVTEISKVAGVAEVHHLHLWSIDGEHHILTAHVKLDDSATIPSSEVLKNEIKALLKKKYHIIEATLELEWPNEHCLDPSH
jgi:cobalt-zinc-cadmium efflux system protein